MAGSLDFITTQISFLVSATYTPEFFLNVQTLQECDLHKILRCFYERIMLTLEWVHKPERLSLIHVPISLYPFFVQPILRVLFGDDNHYDAVDLSWTKRHHFLNVSITPVECSISCSVKLADQYFRPLIDSFNSIDAPETSKTIRAPVEISAEDFVVIEVAGQGPEAGQRVVDLTSPLAMAGIPIFFVTTYFSDYILVPAKTRKTVTKALEQRGFIFSKQADAFVSQLSPSSPNLAHHAHNQSSSSNDLSPTSIAPPTPPAQTVPELQTRTFSKLKRYNITPYVDNTIRLAHCAGHKHAESHQDDELQQHIIQILLATVPSKKPTLSSSAPSPPFTGLYTELNRPPPHPTQWATRFLALTLTDDQPLSILLESHLRAAMPPDALLGSNDVLVPIVLDLRELSPDVTGIVCGVAGRLAQANKEAVQRLELGEGDRAEDVGEISFLSTARAGTVIVRDAELERAVRALEGGMKGE